MPRPEDSLTPAALRARRGKLGLTQAGLAAELGVVANTVARWERGEKRIGYPEWVIRVLEQLEAAAPRGQLSDGRAQPSAPGSSPALQSASPILPAREAMANSAPDLSEGLAEPQTHNLPGELSSFIGRECEVDEVRGRFLGNTRLVTLTGAGGIGKTRLALRVAAGLVPEYRDGVWLVQFAPLGDPGLVARAVALTLGLPEQPERPLPTALADHLQRKEILLVFDNCEHLVAACAEMADLLLRACPSLHILATSREPLGIAGEATWQVPPLSLPDSHLPQLVEQIMQHGAVRLFAQRAVASEASFVVTQQNAPALLDVCRRLDGIPLAIELAAARVKVLSMEQIAVRLEDCFRLLVGSSRTAPPRHHTLKATIDWSYDLLTETEQRLFRSLAVFAGGWTLEAAEAVCADAHIEAENVLGLLAHLVDKSLVTVEHSKTGNPRYKMLETLRQYAWQKLLAVDEANTLRSRHVLFYLRLAEHAEPHLQSAGRATWLARLDEEIDNFWTAMAWLIDRGAAEQGLRLASALTWFWLLRGYFGEGHAWLVQLLALPHAPSAGRAKALWLAGRLTRWLGDLEAARALYDEALEVARRVGDSGTTAWVLCSLGPLLTDQGDYVAARAQSEAGLALFLEIGDAWGTIHGLVMVGMFLLGQREYDTARVRLEAAVALARREGDPSNVAEANVYLGDIACAEGDYSSARARYEESLVLGRELGDRRIVARVYTSLGELAHAQGDYDVARELLRQGLVSYQQLGIRIRMAKSLESIAAVASAQAQPERALRLAAAAARLHEALGTRLLPRDQAGLAGWLQLSRQTLSKAAAATAWSEGQALSVEDAVAYALTDLDSPALDATRSAAPRADREAGARTGAAYPDGLSPREVQVLRLIAGGRSNREIANELVVSVRTVEHHVGSIYGKIAAGGRVDAATYALQHNLVSSSIRAE
jgi:predicted ATPase/DNA-binding CsgD family transcriptional regulator/DNA-binding XRE family transcriptional regulator